MHILAHQVFGVDICELMFVSYVLNKVALLLLSTVLAPHRLTMRTCIIVKKGYL